MFVKYPKTFHIEGSKQEGDDKSFSKLKLSCADKHIVIEEKMDGTQVGFWFNPQGEIQLQSRGTIIQGGNQEFNLLKAWLSSHYSDLKTVLGQRYIIFGEWLYHKHSIFYDQLPDYFLEYDIYDKDSSSFLDTPRRMKLLKTLPFINSVKVLENGIFSNALELSRLVKHSHFISQLAPEHLKHQSLKNNIPTDKVLHETETSGLMEGLYIKVEEDGVVTSRYKFIRASFIQHITKNQHWKQQSTVTNLTLQAI